MTCRGNIACVTCSKRIATPGTSLFREENFSMTELEQFELDVRGMTCDSCAIHVTKALKSVTGVQDADVPGWQSGRATVVAGADVDAKAISAAVQLAGYTATVKTRKAVGGPTP